MDGIDNSTNNADESRVKASRRIRAAAKRENLQTRVPAAMHHWLKAYAATAGLTLADLHERMFAEFLADRPWYAQDWHWRQPQAVVQRISGMDARTGEWVQHNVQLTEYYSNIIKTEADKAGISVASFIFSSVFWATLTIYRPR
jgi:hypothetical protein